MVELFEHTTIHSDTEGVVEIKEEKWCFIKKEDLDFSMDLVARSLFKTTEKESIGKTIPSFDAVSDLLICAALWIMNDETTFSKGLFQWKDVYQKTCPIHVSFSWCIVIEKKRNMESIDYNVQWIDNINIWIYFFIVCWSYKM